MTSPQLILVCSLKGGVGKTTIAVGLAKALSRQGHTVGILDIDTKTPDVPVAFGEEAERAELSRTHGDLIVPPTVQGVQIMSMAYLWSPDSVVDMPDEDALADVRHLLESGVLAWDPEYVVVDSPPAASGMIRGALEAPGLYGALIVTHPSRVARADCRRTIDMLREAQVPVIGLVSNMGTDGRGVQLFDLTDDDIRELAESQGIRTVACLRHFGQREDTDGAFDALATLVLSVEPVVLEKPEPDTKVWNAAVKLARSLQK